MDNTLPSNVKQLKLVKNREKAEEKITKEITKKKWDLEHEGQHLKLKIVMKECGLDINYVQTISLLDKLPPELRSMMASMPFQMHGPKEIEETVIHHHVHYARWQRILHIPLSWLAKRELLRIRKRFALIAAKTHITEAERLQKELEGDD